MTPQDFLMWVRGVLEASPEGLSAERVKMLLAKAETVTLPVVAPPPAPPSPPRHEPLARC